MKMKISGKLLLTGAAVILIPLAVIGFFAVRNASNALQDLEFEQLESRSAELADGVENVLTSEKKVVLAIAAGNGVIEAAAMMDTEGQEAASQQLDSLSEELARMSATEGLGGYAEHFIFIDMDGIVVAANSDTVIGINVNDRDYFQGAKSGKVTIGTPAISKATGNPFIGIAAPAIMPDGRVGGCHGYAAETGKSQYPDRQGENRRDRLRIYGGCRKPGHRPSRSGGRLSGQFQ